jgi:hypothetical protein
MKLSIITACSRPENLDAIRKSITFECVWHIIYDSATLTKKFTEPWIIENNLKGGIVGNAQKSMGLDLVEDGWVYFLDDDNIIHPSFYETISGFVTEHPELEAWVFNQDCGNGDVRWAIPENIKVGCIDLAQFMLGRQLLGSTRFEQVYESDGLIVESLYKRYRPKFGHILDTICYYNYLRR